MNRNMVTGAIAVCCIGCFGAVLSAQAQIPVGNQGTATMVEPSQVVGTSWPAHVPLQTRCDIALNLRQNNRGESVRELQQVLVDKGYLQAENATGFFGPVTREAVRKFQKDNGVEQVGFIGPRTRALFLTKCGNALRNPPQNQQGVTPIGSYDDRQPTDVPAPMKEDQYRMNPAPARNTAPMPIPAPTTPVEAKNDAIQGSIQVVTPDMQKKAEEYARMYGLSLSDTAPVQNSICAPGPLVGDFNRDSKVDVWDLVIYAEHKNKPVPAQYPAADIDNDGYVRFSDLVGLAQNWRKTACAN